MTDNHTADTRQMGPVTEASFQMTLPVFSQLLEPVGIAPALDFDSSGRLLCNQLPDLALRTRIRFIIDRSVRFELSGDEEVRRLLKHWRAELSPQLEGSEEEDFVSGFEDDEALLDTGIRRAHYPAGESPVRPRAGSERQRHSL